jgi:hypothetical protein
VEADQGPGRAGESQKTGSRDALIYDTSWLVFDAFSARGCVISKSTRRRVDDI